MLLPVSRLTQLMADITKKENYSRRWGSDIKEIQALGDTFNAMLVAVEDGDSSEAVIVQLEEVDPAQQAAESAMFLANMSPRCTMNGVLGMVSVLGAQLMSASRLLQDRWNPRQTCHGH